MSRIAAAVLLTGVAGVAFGLSALPARAADEPVRTGTAAYGDWKADAPGVRRHITPADLPEPLATKPVSNPSAAVAPPAGGMPKVPAGFTIEQFADGLKGARLVRVAPNGDIFVAETSAGRIRVIRAADGANKPSAMEIFASGLTAPFGIAFYPAGPNPQFIYIANRTSVVRFPYQNGDMKVRGAAQIIVPKIPEGGHSTRDIRFSPDGSRMFLSVGSGSNDAEGIKPGSPDQIKAFDAAHGLGATPEDETGRANVLYTNPDGSGGLHPFATGIRNCVGMAIHPATGDLWCATNERDILGDNLPPDYVTRVKAGGFYGWPWYYIGNHEDPGHKGQRPDLAGKVTTPDVLLQPHSAPLELTFYDGGQFPAEYKGDGSVALHGSWNRSGRTGYKVARIILKNGQPTGEYEDFLTGLVANESSVWGRPVGVAVAHDGSLLVTEDVNGTMWRVAYTGK